MKRYFFIACIACWIWALIGLVLTFEVDWQFINMTIGAGFWATMLTIVNIVIWFAERKEERK